MIGHSLVCSESRATADAILIENFDVDYLPFERASQLQADGVSARILIPIRARADNDLPGSVDRGIVELMTGVARLRNWQTIPVHESEPYALRVAQQVKEFLAREKIRSIVIVAPGFRSRRSSLVYNAVLQSAGVNVSCVPTVESTTAETWTQTWHGIQEVALQFAKLQYYRFYVLPRYAWE